MKSWLSLVIVLSTVTTVFADGIADNNPETVRRIPKLGIEVSAGDRAALEQGLKLLDAAIDPLRKNPASASYLPDVLIYHKAVQDALTYQEFFDAKEIAVAKVLLQQGLDRAASLASGETPWLDKTGPIARGYISKIDGSVQPYGLVVPATYSRKSPHRWRLDFWFHGRGEVLSELNFVNDRRQNPGQFTPPDTLVLHPYGRYCNASKFAGEIDALEALAAVKRDYRLDDDRISVRGFSMGGASCWQFATHYTDRWFAAAPGAGFSETPDFLKVFQKEELRPTWWETKLWRWYDCTDYAENLANLPTIAYSGATDSQKQAADVMAVALKNQGIELLHIIGPETGHTYEAKAKLEIDRRMDALADIGRKRVPQEVRLVTYMLRYNKMHWVEVEGLERQWEKATVEAVQQAIGPEAGPDFRVVTKNVTRLKLNFGSGEYPFDITEPAELLIDNQGLKTTRPASDRSWSVVLSKVDGQWQVADDKGSSLRKKPGLQGPIDDALMDSFIFVRPTGKPQHELIGKWCDAELERAIEHWRRHFRGVARVKKDTEITDADMQQSHLILWGDPQSNAILSKVMGKLPIKWEQGKIVAGEQNYSADAHALIAIYPNPLSPEKYVVLNSSFTFRDYAYLNNARQVPMLPDWAIVDVRTPPSSVWPGKVVDADFFGEQWQFQRTPR